MNLDEFLSKVVLVTKRAWVLSSRDFIIKWEIFKTMKKL